MSHAHYIFPGNARVLLKQLTTKPNLTGKTLHGLIGKTSNILTASETHTADLKPWPCTGASQKRVVKF